MKHDCAVSFVGGGGSGARIAKVDSVTGQIDSISSPKKDLVTRMLQKLLSSWWRLEKVRC